MSFYYFYVLALLAIAAPAALAHHLDNATVKVVVLTTSYPRDADDVAGTFVRDGVEALRARRARGAGRLARDFRHYGIAYGDGIVNNLRAGAVEAARAAALPRSRSRAPRAGPRRDADVVHAHWLPSALPALATGKPFVLQLWGSDVALARRVRPLARLARPPRPDRRLRLVGARRGRTRARGARRARDPERRSRSRRPSVRPEEPPHVLYVGRLSEEKGVRELAEAARGLPLVVVGDGPLRSLFPQAIGLRAASRLGPLLRAGGRRRRPVAARGLRDGRARGDGVRPSGRRDRRRWARRRDRGRRHGPPRRRPATRRALRTAIERLLGDRELRNSLGANAALRAGGALLARVGCPGAFSRRTTRSSGVNRRDPNARLELGGLADDARVPDARRAARRSACRAASRPSRASLRCWKGPAWSPRSPDVLPAEARRGADRRQRTRRSARASSEATRATCSSSPTPERLTRAILAGLRAALAGDSACTTVSFDEGSRPVVAGVPPPAIDHPRAGVVLVRRIDLLLAWRRGGPDRTSSSRGRRAETGGGPIVSELLALLERPGFVHRASASTAPVTPPHRVDPRTRADARLRRRSRRKLPRTSSDRDAGAGARARRRARAGGSRPHGHAAARASSDRRSARRVARRRCPLRRAARLGRPDILHRPFQVVSLHDLADRLEIGERFVLTHQDMIWDRTRAYHVGDARRDYRRATSAALSVADEVGFFSFHAAIDAASDGALALDRATVVPLGVDHLAGRDVAGDAARPLAGRPYLLMVGSSFWHKNRVFSLRLLEWLVDAHGWDGGLVLVGGHHERTSSRRAEERVPRTGIVALRPRGRSRATCPRASSWRSIATPSSCSSRRSTRASGSSRSKPRPSAPHACTPGGRRWTSSCLPSVHCHRSTSRRRAAFVAGLLSSAGRSREHRRGDLRDRVAASRGTGRPRGTSPCTSARWRVRGGPSSRRAARRSRGGTGTSAPRRTPPGCRRLGAACRRAAMTRSRAAGRPAVGAGDDRPGVGRAGSVDPAANERLQHAKPVERSSASCPPRASVPCT